LYTDSILFGWIGIQIKSHRIPKIQGDEADPEIEDLALRTGGKSFYVDDSSAGAGGINDAFTGSTTYQPGDTAANTSATLYQRDWSGPEITAGGAKGRVVLDPRIRNRCRSRVPNHKIPKQNS
jgi:hypothetical protein